MKTPTSLKRGFTLVEIMIVVEIIGLLSAVAIPNLVKARKNAQRKACKANLNKIEFVIQQWALKKRKNDDSEVSLEGLEFNDDIPKCPSGGKYELGTVVDKPTCNVPGHNNYPMWVRKDTGGGGGDWKPTNMAINEKDEEFVIGYGKSVWSYRIERGTVYALTKVSGMSDGVTGLFFKIQPAEKLIRVKTVAGEESYPVYHYYKEN